MTEIFEPGSVIVTPGSFIGIVKYPADQADREALARGRVPLVADQARPLAGLCRLAAQARDLPADLCNVACTSGETFPTYLPRASRAGFTVLCRCTVPWGDGRQVRTPCCDRIRRVASQPENQMVTCPGCQWFWRLLLGTGLQTRWVSYGYGRQQKRRGR